jgi:hypothetical protein
MIHPQGSAETAAKIGEMSLGTVEPLAHRRTKRRGRFLALGKPDVNLMTFAVKALFSQFRKLCREW